MISPPASKRLALHLLAGAALLAAPAIAHAATVADRLDFGRGPQGEFCEGRRVWSDPARADLFDSAFDMRCRGWTETVWQGRVYAVADSAAARAAFLKGRDARFDCAAAGRLAIAGLGDGEGARCRDRASGFAALSLSVTRGGRRFAAVGLEPFAANLAAGMRRAAGVSEPAAPPLLALAELGAAPPAAASVPGGIDGDIGTVRDEVRSYSTRGQHADARELANLYAARPAGATSPADRIDLELEAALSDSNLDFPDAAAARLDRARTDLASAPSLAGQPGDFLRNKLVTYEAFEALNRRNFEIALAKADIALVGMAAPAAGATAQPLASPAVLRELNSRRAADRGGAVEVRDTSWVPASTLRAAGHYIRGASLAGLGRPADAAMALAAAAAELAQPGYRSLQTANLGWLKASIAAEQARLAESAGKREAAGPFYTASVRELEDSAIYRDSPLLAQRRLDRANYLRRAGKIADARAEFDAAMVTLVAAGPSAASSVSGLDGYFDILGKAAAAGDADAVAALFLAAQFVNPPALTAQIATLKKIYENSSADGAAKARALQDFDRERRGIAARLAALPLTAAATDRQALEAERDAIEARLKQVRGELTGNAQYLRASDSAVELAELKASLAPKEAYFKLVWLPRQSYAVYVTRDISRVYPLGARSDVLGDQVSKVRKSIDGIATPRGNVVIDFDVDGARALDVALFAPVQAAMAGIDSLIVDAAGPFNQLPLGVLIGDDASLAAYLESARTNALDYSKVGFLAARMAISTTVSPRALLVARSQPASRAPNPYIGFGDALAPGAAMLAVLPSRGAFAGCRADGAVLAAEFGALKPIPASELDAGARALGAGSDKVLGAAFSDSSLIARRDYSGYEVVHFATHGLKEGELGCDSPPALVTSVADNAGSDGLLSFEEIAQLSFDANLVILSACNTAAETGETRALGLGFRVGQAGQGATLNGLVRAFLFANARAVLTTHWAIPNKTTTRDGRTLLPSTLLLEALFASGRDTPVAVAVQRAQARMREVSDISHPYYWGAFALVGDGAKPMLTAPASKAAGLGSSMIASNARR